MLLYFFLRGDESDYSEDAPYGENKSDDGSTGSVSKTSVTELKKTNDVLVMTTYIQDIIGEVFGDSNDQVRFQFHINKGQKFKEKQASNRSPIFTKIRKMLFYKSLFHKSNCCTFCLDFSLLCCTTNLS